MIAASDAALWDATSAIVSPWRLGGSWTSGQPLPQSLKASSTLATNQVRNSPSGGPGLRSSRQRGNGFDCCGSAYQHRRLIVRVFKPVQRLIEVRHPLFRLVQISHLRMIAQIFEQVRPIPLEHSFGSSRKRDGDIEVTPHERIYGGTTCRVAPSALVSVRTPFGTCMNWTPLLERRPNSVIGSKADMARTCQDVR